MSEHELYFFLNEHKPETPAQFVGQVGLQAGKLGARSGKAAFSTEPQNDGDGYTGRLEGRLHGAARYGLIATFNQDDAWNVVIFDTVPGLTIRVVRATGEFTVRFSL